MEDELIELLNKAIEEINDKEEGANRPMSAGAAKQLEIMRALRDGLSSL